MFLSIYEIKWRNQKGKQYTLLNKTWHFGCAMKQTEEKGR